ncbi:M24 family metallopeptidase [Dethiobacter alkaliphilus]|uniref:Peptidase M24 n=1 Tax=Dethiobacter alkaliphilus AHT 1 TaxID=555088 RepID=C0GF56_DETAL|nr:Xaa-Pro peptidase family protein [Dethiobacter alkaliphilus]EEG78238.1 peptidase M24 [Dethiobacter alkaliphilus AHT 1]
MVPKDELLRRKSVLQEKLKAMDLDGALLAQKMSMYYYSGTMQCQYVYVPAQGECLGLVRRNMSRAQQEAGIALTAMAGFSGLPKVIADNAAAPKRMGLEMDVLPAAIYVRLNKAFAGVSLEDASGVLRECRQVKSAYELEQLQAAAIQVDKIHRLVPKILTEGMEELHFAAELEAALRKLGHQGSARMRGFNQEMFYGHVLSGQRGAAASFLDSPTGGVGLSPAQPQGAGNKVIQAGEPVTVDYGGIHNGYIVDQTRLYSIGQLPSQLAQAFEVALAVQEAVVAAAKPGVTGGELYEAALAVAQKAGLDGHFMGVGDTQAKYVGHGVGLEFDEFPILAKGSPHVLAADMVVAVEPKFTFADLGVVGIENTWQVTKDGLKKISVTDDKHVII